MFEIDASIMGAETKKRSLEGSRSSRSFVGSHQVGWTSRENLAYRVMLDEEHEQGSEHASYFLHFWALVEPLERAVLRLFPVAKGAAITGSLKFYNSSGLCVNECAIACRPGQLVHLPLESFLDECETESGLRHAHVVLESSVECNGELEMSSRARTFFMPPLAQMDEQQPRAVPLLLAREQRHVVAIVNPNDVQCSVKCRLYVGSRTPEEVCLIPPRATVLVSPEVMFSPVLREFQQEELQAYLRIATRSPKSLGVQLLEERTFESGDKVYGVIA